jgi:two-component system invasion response regulator UvrY
MNPISILIADDHQLIRETWSFILAVNKHFRVIGECASGEDAIEICRIRQPDIVLMDINLPGINGIEATALIRKISPGTKILAVSMHKQPAYAKKMFQNGAIGYITKNSSSGEMFTAINELMAGRKYICNEIKDILSDQMMSETPNNGFHTLSKRELEIIALLKQGLSSREIANRLDLALKTVEVHRYNILKKLDLRNTASLVNYIYSKEALG